MVILEAGKESDRRALSLYFHREPGRVKGTYGHDTLNRRELNIVWLSVADIWRGRGR